MVLGGGIDGDALFGQDRRDPLGRPGAFGGIVNLRERLERDAVVYCIRQAAAEIVPVAAHRERRCSDRAAEIKREDLGVPIPAELKRHERQQHRLAGAGRTHNQGVADIADMERKPEGRRTLGLAEEQRRRAKMLIPFRPGPHRGEWHHVRQVQRRDRRLADVGVDMPGQRAEPGFDGIDAFRDAGEVAALDDLLHEAKFFGRESRIGVPDRDAGGDVGFADIVGAELL
jgi:hypothetical protein